MRNHNKPCTCGGRFKKRGVKPENPRDGSRYFQCERCHKLLEVTAEGYEFFDEGKAPEKKPEPEQPRVRSYY